MCLISQAEELCHLDPEFCKQARIDVFRQAYLALVADHDLTEEEDGILSHVRTSLAVGEEDVALELQFVERLREIRAIRAGELPTVRSSTPLAEDEICHDESPVRLLKARILRSYQSGGQKYKVRGLVVDKEGALALRASGCSSCTTARHPFHSRRSSPSTSTAIGICSRLQKMALPHLYI